MLRKSSAAASMAIQPLTTAAGRWTQQAATRPVCAAAASRSKARRGQFGRSTIASSPASAGVNNKAQIISLILQGRKAIGVDVIELAADVVNGDSHHEDGNEDIQ